MPRSVFALLVSLLLPAAVSEGAVRIRQDLSEDWQFVLADHAGLESPDYLTRQGWQMVNLPHTWNTTDTFDDVPGYHRGVGWYRREFNVPAEYRGKRLFLRFEAVAQVGIVWVNGKLLGEHKGAFTPFEFDITDVASVGGRNLVAVRVDNRWRRDVPPYDMDFNMMGGIPREVYLVAADPLRIVSVRTTTPRVSRTEGVAAFQVEVRNESAASREVELVTKVVDAAGAPVWSTVSPVRVPAGAVRMVSQESTVIRNPKLWSPAAPNLYRARFEVRVNGRIVDDEESPLGFRWYRFDPERGFFLNGEPLKLRGANRHDDYPGLGWALPPSRHVADLKLLKSMGANFLRPAHYAQHPAVLDACDRLGLLVWEEIPFDGEGEQLAPYPGATACAETVKQMLRDTIRRDRNHPSIIVWSVGNENMNGATETEWRTVANLEKELAQLAKEEDPTRVTGIAIDRLDRAEKVGLPDVVDVVGCNVYRGWYAGRFEDFGPLLDDFHRKHPTKPLVITEYGADMELGRHTEAPRRYDFSEEWGCLFHEAYLREINARPFVAGSLLWNIFDFGVEKRLNQATPHYNQKGIFDYHRRPKDAFYFYQSQWTAEPMVYLVSHTWTGRQGEPGEKKSLKVYSNCETVELFVNGKSAGSQRGGTSVWQVTLQAGDNDVRAVGSQGGRQVQDSVRIRY
jgi:beta-galactosidase